MRILVTGATGFTGANLVRRLLQLGHDVTMLDLTESDVSRELEALSAKMVVGTVTDAALVERVSQGQEIVFHLAAAFRDINAPPSLYRRVNVDGTRNVLAAADRNGVRKVLHCSTSGVHGGGNLPRNEDSPIAPGDIYQKTKLAGEEVCQEFIARGLDVTIIRPTSEYGPGDVSGMKSLFRMVKRGRFFMFGSGRGFLHPVYIDNLVDLFVLAMENPSSKGRAYLAGDAHPVSQDELVKAVGRALGVNVKIIHVPLLKALYYAGWAMEIVCRPLRIILPFSAGVFIGFRPIGPMRSRGLSWNSGTCP